MFLEHLSRQGGRLREKRWDDLQVLPVQVPQQLQDEAQPAQGEVDQGVQGGPGQGPDERHDVRAGEEAEQAGEVQPRHHAEDPEGHGEDHGDPKPARVQVHREPLEGEEEAGEAAGEEAARPGDPPIKSPAATETVASTSKAKLKTPIEKVRGREKMQE